MKLYLTVFDDMALMINKNKPKPVSFIKSIGTWELDAKTSMDMVREFVYDYHCDVTRSKVMHEIFTKVL